MSWVNNESPKETSLEVRWAEDTEARDDLGSGSGGEPLPHHLPRPYQVLDLEWEVRDPDGSGRGPWGRSVDDVLNVRFHLSVSGEGWTRWGERNTPTPRREVKTFLIRLVTGQKRPRH